MNFGNEIILNDYKILVEDFEFAVHSIPTINIFLTRQTNQCVYSPQKRRRFF